MDVRFGVFKTHEAVHVCTCKTSPDLWGRVSVVIQQGTSQKPQSHSAL